MYIYMHIHVHIHVYVHVGSHPVSNRMHQTSADRVRMTMFPVPDTIQEGEEVPSTQVYCIIHEFMSCACSGNYGSIINTCMRIMYAFTCLVHYKRRKCTLKRDCTCKNVHAQRDLFSCI